MKTPQVKRFIMLSASSIVLLALLLFNCENEDLNTSNETTSTVEHTISKVSKHSIVNNTKLKKQLKVLVENIEKQKVKQKTVESSVYNFYINTDYATYIESPNGNNHSYTFAIQRETETEVLENLVLSSGNDGSYDMYIVTYNITLQEKDNLKHGIEVDLNNKVSYLSINDEGFITDLFSKEITCLEIAISFCKYEIEGHVDGYEEDGSRCGGYTEQVIGTVGDCDSSSNGNTTGTDTSNTNDTSNTDTTNTTNTDTTSTNTTNPNGGAGNNTVATSPTTICRDCLEFDEECEMSDEDFNASFSANSPFNVDLSEVRKNCNTIDTTGVASNEKFMCIYKKLTQSPKFKDLFIDTFGESENLNVKFEVVDNIAPVPPSDVEPNGKTLVRIDLNATNPLESYDVTIKINKSKMDNQSAIYVAKTIIHEAIHAFLKLKQYGCNQGSQLEDFDDVELSEILNQYYSTACTLQSDHEFMFDYLLPVMSNILSEIKDDLVPLNHQQGAEGQMFVDESNPNGPMLPWNWNSFYKYLSMSGLHNSDAFQFEMLPVSSAKYQNFNHYVNTGRNLFKKDCLD